MKGALLWAGGTVGLQLGVCLLSMHLVLNRTPSLPEGFYWRLGMPPTLTRGDLVELTPPDGVFVVLQQQPPPRITTMLKRIGAVGGDEVCWSPAAMSTAAHWWPRSPTHPLAEGVLGCVTLDDDEVVLVGEHPRSCDSRDFGPVHRGHILGAVIPLWTWGR